MLPSVCADVPGVVSAAPPTGGPGCHAFASVCSSSVPAELVPFHYDKVVETLIVEVVSAYALEGVGSGIAA